MHHSILEERHEQVTHWLTSLRGEESIHSIRLLTSGIVPSAGRRIDF